jgi:hypothetical protein
MMVAVTMPVTGDARRQSKKQEKHPEERLDANHRLTSGGT